MKNKIIQKILVLFSVVLLAYSCEAPQDNGLESAVKNGRGLVTEIFKIYYQAQTEINYSVSKKQNLALILTGESIDNMGKPLVLVDNYEVKQNILSTYDNILANYFEMSDDELKSEILHLINQFDSLNVKNEDLTTDLEKMKKYAGSVNFSREKAIYGLSDLIYRMYFADVLVWQHKLDSAYNDFSEKLNQIPDDVFDQTKLEKFVYEPYKGKQNLVKIYKMNLKEEAYEEKVKFTDKANKILLLYQDYEKVLQEIGKKSPDIFFIKDMNHRIASKLSKMSKQDELNN